mmetsp:Transcript_9124/g.22653  ORF Transcript_9124/g.22653 Transcript_9124/m.22653 type:complete len:307 (+) Transcript_9124:197-1117(+)|eukprot:CAMPEP_0116085232 /NCGR_PEP_ID=MMETSP0327-20121206/4214_1 /TAXON_ID=44447 /ORGANISM="Pseudo-nitzschia delicatissima, Strain B596" /LENGTH=306 /DNA_ID=CAMNT_0003576207 /DNA_START=27 /DNA_END=947 /DNA_ORIENTATION=-
MPPKKKVHSKSVRREEVEESDVEDMTEQEDETDDEDRGRGKRKRRESKSYEPDDFTMASVNAASKAATVFKGRGKKLGNIEAVDTNMKKYKISSDEFVAAYKFLFNNRGTSNKKLMKDKLFEFSGYLPPLPKGKYDKKKQDNEEEMIETKYAIKAFKMNVSQIKALCTFFCVDHCGEDGKSLIKEDMIDRLMDFLEAPDESLIKQTTKPVEKKKKVAAKKKKDPPRTKRSSVATKVSEDPFSLIKDYTKGKVPSDKAMRQWVKAYIVCVDMETATTKDAVLTATAKFGVDMASKKARIKQLLAEEI